MPLFYHVQPNPATKTTHHKHVQADQKKKQSTARTLLPMNGGTSGAASNPSSPPVGSTPRVTTTSGSSGLMQTGGQTGGQSSSGVITLIPNDAEGGGKTAMPRSGDKVAGAGTPGKHEFKWVHENYFDAGAEDLIGTFTTLVLRYGVRYDQEELHVYFRNETLNTTGTNLPFQSIIQGSSVGVAYRHWFPGNHFFATVSDGRYLSGFQKNNYDFRAGMVGYWDWHNDKVFSDIYSDLFYIDLAQDTFLTGRIRSGIYVMKDKTGAVLGYGVAQLFASGKGANGSENRVEAGYGVGYVFQNKISLNIEMRAGYAFRGLITNRAYLNPMIVLSGSL